MWVSLDTQQMYVFISVEILLSFISNLLSYSKGKKSSSIRIVFLKLLLTQNFHQRKILGRILEPFWSNGRRDQETHSLAHLPSCSPKEVHSWTVVCKWGLGFTYTKKNICCLSEIKIQLVFSIFFFLLNLATLFVNHYFNEKCFIYIIEERIFP